MKLPRIRTGPVIAATACAALLVLGLAAVRKDWLQSSWHAATRAGSSLLARADRAPWPVLDRYCVGCHNEIDLAGDTSFERLDRADVGHERRRLGSRRSQAPDAGSCRRAASRAPIAQCSSGMASWLEQRARRGVGAAAESRHEAARTPEPNRVRERDPRSPGLRPRSHSRRRCRKTSPSAGSTTSRRRSACRRPCSKATRKPRCRSAGVRSAIARWATARRATRRKVDPRSSGTSRGCRSARAAGSQSSTASLSTPNTRSRCRPCLPSRRLGQSDRSPRRGATAQP